MRRSTNWRIDSLWPESRLGRSIPSAVGTSVTSAWSPTWLPIPTQTGSLSARWTGAQKLRRWSAALPTSRKPRKIAYAKVGAKLFNSHSGKVEELKAAKIRGVVSEGMICSQLELGMGDDHTGILVLPEQAPVGMGLAEYLGDQILVLELTPNRSDCLSMLGVASETAALTGELSQGAGCLIPRGWRTHRGPGLGGNRRPGPVPPLYRRPYSGGVVADHRQAWMQERLEKAGMRPVNNIVDITNYVMLEFNQPLHAFDFDHSERGQGDCPPCPPR